MITTPVSDWMAYEGIQLAPELPTKVKLQLWGWGDWRITAHVQNPIDKKDGTPTEKVTITEYFFSTVYLSDSTRATIRLSNGIIFRARVDLIDFKPVASYVLDVDDYRDGVYPHYHIGMNSLNEPYLVIQCATPVEWIAVYQAPIVATDTRLLC